MSQFKPIKRNRISETIAAQLKEALLAGTFKPGERMPTERELTEQFQVSRLVIREAIRELERTGFVKILQGPTGGAYVTDLSFDPLSNAFLDLFLVSKLSVTEVFQARLHMEPEIARLAAKNVHPAQVERLEEALALEVAAGIPYGELIARRFMVDRLLAEMSGNRLYQAISKALQDLTREIILVVKPVMKVIFDHQGHVAIVAAVAAGDSEGAAEAVRRHVAGIGEDLTELERAYRLQKGLAR